MMKIMVNYDLIDKAREAKTGFSLNKYIFSVGLSNAIVIPSMLLGAHLGGRDFASVLEPMLTTFGYSLFYNTMHFLLYKGYCKDRAMIALNKLALELDKICFDTDAQLLTEVYKYDVKYEFNFDNFPTKLVQKKYIMIPIHNNWGNNERSLVQEHIVGTCSYVLSYGGPENKKTNLYTKTKTLNNGR